MAGFSNDAYNSALPDIELFKIFDKEDIRQNLKSILYNALLGKTRSINFFHNVYYSPGNILRMVSEYEIEEDFDELFNSFFSYIELSMLSLKKTKNSVI